MSIITLVILILSLKMLFDISAKYKKKLTGKIKSLERETNGTKKNIYTEAEKFRVEITTPWDYETEGEGPKLLENQF